MEEAIEFLKLNGFSLAKWSDNTYCNPFCCIIVTKSKFEVYNAKTAAYMCNKDLNIYWLIGVLTYHGHLDKNYKQLNNQKSNNA